MKKHKYTNKWEQENHHKCSRKEKNIKGLSCPNKFEMLVIFQENRNTKLIPEDRDQNPIMRKAIQIPEQLSKN